MGSNTRYFELARLASNQSNQRYPVGAVIVVRQPVTVGWNQDKTHPKYADGKRAYSIHAEISALLHARCNVSGGVIYVYRADHQGNRALAKPCPTCLTEIIEAGIRRIFYTVPYPPGYEVIEL